MYCEIEFMKIGAYKMLVYGELRQTSANCRPVATCVWDEGMTA